MSSTCFALAVPIAASFFGVVRLCSQNSLSLLRYTSAFSLLLLQRFSYHLLTSWSFRRSLLFFLAAFFPSTDFAFCALLTGGLGVWKRRARWASIPRHPALFNRI